MDKAKELLQLLEKSLLKLPNQKLAMAFSGGVDSALLAKILLDNDYNLKGYVVGTENSHDIKAARKVSKELDLDLEEIIIDRREVRKAMKIQTSILDKLYNKKKKELKGDLPPLHPNPVSISFNLPLYFVCKYAKEKYIISGQGPDTMLGGFMKHLKLDKDEAIKKMKKDTNDLINIGYLQHKVTGEYFNKRVIMPFLDKEIVSYCLKLPYELKINSNTRKYIIREAAKIAGLSKSTALRRKKSAQYGSKIMNLMKKVAKNENTHVSKYIKKLRKK